MRDRYSKMKCQLLALARTKFVFANGALAIVSLISCVQCPFPELPVPFPGESRLNMYEFDVYVMGSRRGELAFQ